MSKEITKETVTNAISEIFRVAGIKAPTQRDMDIASRAVIYAGPHLYSESPELMTPAYFDKREFEVRALAYFGRHTNPNSIEMIMIFDNYEQKELTNIRYYRTYFDRVLSGLMK